jgi:low affinity Fe/Cu permease
MTDTSLFTKFSHHVAHAAGRPQTFALACAGIVVWAISGPVFGFSETWQLVVNTATTIITFLMVFVVQNTQNRDGEAIQAKLDELIRASQAENEFIGAERLTEKELHQLREMCVEHAAKKASKTSA